MGAQWKSKGKAQVADAKGKLFGKLAKEIMVAARGGADPAANSKLRLVVEQARKVSMPKETLDRAIKKGAGLTGEAVHFEHVMYEGFAPHRVPVMVECLTDNVNRTAPEMRVLFRKGQLGTSEIGNDLVALLAQVDGRTRIGKLDDHAAGTVVAAAEVEIATRDSSTAPSVTGEPLAVPGEILIVLSFARRDVAIS